MADLNTYRKLSDSFRDSSTTTADVTLSRLDHVNGSMSDKAEVNNVQGVGGSVVVVEGAHKHYGSGTKRVTVLENLHMRVPKGAIYGLLGPSGCGKTTLLGCLVNRLKLDRGSILLYGFPPGTAFAGVPGHRVGYMPQELALYQEFTITETMQYFGRIHQMSAQKITEKTKFLVTFLDLPDPSRLINQLSGGQQRRVSFAAALLHEPDLLILDEPTVGVDPLLRSSIWRHLLDVCGDGATTIIITTHYIEEARQADKVGLMRAGRLLAETSPSSLISHFAMASLEDIFLKLCLEDGDEDDLRHGKHNPGLEDERANNAHSETLGGVEAGEGRKEPQNKALPAARGRTAQLRREVDPVTGQVSLKDSSDTNVIVTPWVKTSKYERNFSLGRFNALLMKNFIRMWRNVGFLLFSFLMPPLQTVLFCLTVGGTPFGLPMAVVNYDTGYTLHEGGALVSEVALNFSNLYLSQISTKTVDQVFYEDFSAGYRAVEEGHAWGLIFFNESFTKGMVAFYLSDDLPGLDPADKEQSKINLYMDNTNYQIAATLYFELLHSLETFMGVVLGTASQLPGFIFNTTFDASKLAFPLELHDPVYGSSDYSFTEFMAPGVLLTITYFMAVGLTALSFIIERKEGLLDRSWVAGVQSSEVMLAHLATQMLVMLVQIALILVFMFPVFQLPCEGNMAWVVLLAVLQGFCGMTFGLMTSAVSNDENTAIMMALGIFYPLLLLSGIVWPIQGIPVALRYISYLLPQTYACEAIRAVLYKGWDITYPIVYLGYLVTIAWLFIHLAVALIAIRIRK